MLSVVVLPLRHTYCQEELAALEELNSAMKSGGAWGTQSFTRRGWRPSSFWKVGFSTSTLCSGHSWCKCKLSLGALSGWISECWLSGWILKKVVVEIIR